MAITDIYSNTLIVDIGVIEINTFNNTYSTQREYRSAYRDIEILYNYCPTFNKNRYCILFKHKVK